MNVSKTQLMVLCRKGKQKDVKSEKVHVDGKEVSKLEAVKYLGIVIDKDLRWKQHIDKVWLRCHAKFAAIRRAGNYLSSHVKKFQTFVLPHLDYCLAVWHSCGVTLSQKIEGVQNYAMRLILRKPHRTSSEPLRRLLQLQTLSHRRANNVLSQVCRCLSNKAPAYLSGKFVRNNTLPRYNATRGAAKLHLRRPKTEFYKRSFEYMGAKLYNELPENRL